MPVNGWLAGRFGSGATGHFQDDADHPFFRVNGAALQRRLAFVANLVGSVQLGRLDSRARTPDVGLEGDDATTAALLKTKMPDSSAPCRRALEFIALADLLNVPGASLALRTYGIILLCPLTCELVNTRCKSARENTNAV